ncbi:hypothetical protein ACMHYJ_14385 [Castellaniella hirudinis]|uniref:hypothetical protein n=1 Tax=Castellaniella hirudinis TaxID=1144617 RepID=UPI0039C2098F
MNTHDKIELPPLPTPDLHGPSGTGAYFNGYTSTTLEAYARLAIEDDRKRRGEPVAQELTRSSISVSCPHCGAGPYYYCAHPFRTGGGAAPVAQEPWQPLAAALYQAAGAYDMPVRFLDVLSAAANGEPFAHLMDGLLPVESPVAQEPVAWMTPGNGRAITELELSRIPTDRRRQDRCREIYPVPLYAAPVAAQDREDALRYRWLRDNAQLFSHFGEEGNSGWCVMRRDSAITRVYTYNGQELDEAIDHARRIEGGNHANS